MTNREELYEEEFIEVVLMDCDPYVNPQVTDSICSPQLVGFASEMSMADDYIAVSQALANGAHNATAAQHHLNTLDIANTLKASQTLLSPKVHSQHKAKPMSYLTEEVAKALKEPSNGRS